MKKEEILETTSLFEGLDPEERRAIAPLIFEKNYARGETIFLKVMMRTVSTWSAMVR